MRSTALRESELPLAKECVLGLLLQARPGCEQDACEKYPLGRGAQAFEEVTRFGRNKEQVRFPLWASPQIARVSPSVK